MEGDRWAAKLRRFDPETLCLSSRSLEEYNEVEASEAKPFLETLYTLPLPVQK